MNVRKAIPVAVALGFCIGAAQAQTLGEIMDKGFKKVDKAEFASVFLGTKISGPNRTGAQMVGEYKPDGTLSGTWSHASSMRQGVFSGTWKLEDSGRICSVVSAGGAPATTCFFFFRNGSQFYYADSDTDRGSSVLPRSVTK